ncbi:hypothetical protein MCOR27_006714 [Pyricularia oryzae]|uniref:Uncharacterized protein n=2 Tax=Pyricularia TaxID=48558 RepID=A0ABQ8NYA5_PYRGI|nr:hypothetical protein MCOR01_009620 [Pyricularia oryzae]KAI6303898.1 hypothetical protein MCOR33_001066 [Pyricularia grisea]KAH9437111.1 hypothetical protein MCOR02_000766 [Pyricularia oryzae]KAI6255914.1 hypothetical protein MCOR19_007596 [Pyricularia oryzae]KAI6274630.1 hypothetical protein MCOR26_006381 [Pyricularia oryzae]
MVTLASPRALPSCLVLLSLAVQLCSASMAAWWVGDKRAPQILRWNATLGAITYSSCHTKDTPAFPLDPPNVLDVAQKPRNGTSLTGQGWWNSKTTAASIFYQAEDGSLVNTYQECDLSTGKFRRLTTDIISKDAPAPIHPESGLASVLLANEGTNEGYRLFYHDDKKQVNVIGFRPATSKFYYDGIVSQDMPSGMALAAGFNSNRNYSVVFPRDDENLEHARATADDSRHGITILPRPLKDSNFGNMTSLANRTGLVLDKDFNMTTVPRLPNWTSNPKLALSTDSGTKRNVFWLGSDRRPHKLYITTQGWALQDTNVGVDEWPAADADSDLALAYERGTDNVRLYYVVGGLLHELRHDKARTGNGYEWKIAAALPVVAPPGTTTSTGGGGSTPNDSTNGGPTTGQETTDSQSGGDGGLSTGAKIGLGVGIALGVVAVGAACMSVWYVRRLKKTQAAARAQADDEEEEKRRRYEQVQQEQQQYNPYQYQQVQQHGGPHYPQSNGTSQFGSEMGSPETTYHYGGYIPDKKAPLASASPVPQEMNATPVVYELPEQRRATEMDGGSDVMSPQSTHR